MRPDAQILILIILFSLLESNTYQEVPPDPQGLGAGAPKDVELIISTSHLQPAQKGTSISSTLSSFAGGPDCVVLALMNATTASMYCLLFGTK